MRQWRWVIFTDAPFHTQMADISFHPQMADIPGVGDAVLLVWGGVKPQLIVIAGNLTAVRYRDEVLCPVAVPPLVQQCQSILQHDNAWNIPTMEQNSKE